MAERDTDSRPPWWDADRLARRLPHLRARQAVLDAVRGFFRARGFTEVETPTLQVSPGLEPHLRAFATDLHEPLGEAPPAPLYLHASPEFAMKKLLSAGMGRIFQIARVFRNGERSALHHPEFTMLEWYRAGAGPESLMADCEALLRRALAAVPPALRGAPHGYVRGERSADPNAPWQSLTVAEAFARHAGIDLPATAPDPARPDAARLGREAARIGVRTAEGDSWEDVFFRVMLERIEPHLGSGAPTLLTGYPAVLAQLARLDPDDPAIAERFELYVCGVELANGYGELTDATEQRRRFADDQARARDLKGEAYPADEDFLAALARGPRRAAGIALGLDRLVMLATGAETIDDVLWAPVVRASGPG